MELFIHFGLHKTGTTFLQENVFPKFRNIILLRTNISKKQLNNIFLSDKEKILISNEGLIGYPWAGVLETGNWIVNHKNGIKKISTIFPNAKIIVSFREHKSLLISLYKQYLHEGGTKRLEGDFFDIKNNNGIIRKEDLLFYKRIEEIEKYFKEKPFVFRQEELKINFSQLLYDLSNFLGENPPDTKEINLTIKNAGVGFYQGKMLRSINILLYPFPLIRRIVNSHMFRRLGISPRSLCQYKLKFISQKNIKLSDEYRKYIYKNYDEDWRKTCSYIYQTRGLKK